MSEEEEFIMNVAKKINDYACGEAASPIPLAKELIALISSDYDHLIEDLNHQIEGFKEALDKQ